jgi:membrane glycosyltransferase
MRVEPAIRIALIATGVFTAVPVLAVIDPSQLASYGVTEPEPMELTLLQHRAVFQLLAGTALVWAAFRRDVRVPVALAVIVSKGSALLLTVTRPEAQALANPAIQLFDLACVVILSWLVVSTLVRRSAARTRAVTA